MPEESLNSNHARRLSVTCRHIDKQLADMENALSVPSSKNAFPEYLSDVTPAQRRVIEDYIARIRGPLARVLDGQGIERPEPSIPVSRSLHTARTFIAIAAEELQPKYMRGYGEVPPVAAVELNGIARDAVAKALAELSDIYRAVFVLRDMQHLDVAETAEALGLGESAAPKRFRSRLATIRT